MRFTSNIFFAGLLFISSIPSTLAGTTPAILGFHPVSEGIFRGARPESAGLIELYNMGIKTDLNLDDDSESNSQEIKTAATLGLNYISRPMSGFFTPDDSQVNGTLAILANSANYPIFVHCQHGQDRTGLIIGLHRVYNEGWAPIRAYQEMLNLGFHSFPLVFLNHYFEVKSGLED